MNHDILTACAITLALDIPLSRYMNPEKTVPKDTLLRILFWMSMGFYRVESVLAYCLLWREPFYHFFSHQKINAGKNHGQVTILQPDELCVIPQGHCHDSSGRYNLGSSKVDIALGKWISGSIFLAKSENLIELKKQHKPTNPS